MESQYNRAARRQQAVRRYVPAHTWGVLLAYIERKRRELAEANPMSPRVKPSLAVAFDPAVWR